jgi:uncharacterized protein YcbX
MTLGTLERIWTYPVKSLRAVPHDAIEIAGDGLVGDRRAALYVAEGHARTGNTYRGKENNRLHLLVEPDDALRVAQERGVALEVRAGERYFDARPVSLILDVWVREVEQLVGRSLDPLRWRPNLYVTAAGPIDHGELVGKHVSVGGALLSVVKPIGRCVTPSYDQESGESDRAVMRAVAQHRENYMGVYCEVERGGNVRVGDALELN